MRDLVHDGVADDLGLASRRRRDPFDRPAKDADTVGEVGLLRAALGEWDSFVQTEERAPSRKLLWRGLIFDHDLEIADALAELRGQLVQSVAHQAREARAAQIGHDRTVASRGACQTHAGERSRAKAADA